MRNAISTGTSRAAFALLVALLAPACGGVGMGSDASVPDAARAEGSVADGGNAPDASRSDGAAQPDAPPSLDGGGDALPAPDGGGDALPAPDGAVDPVDGGSADAVVAMDVPVVPDVVALPEPPPDAAPRDVVCTPSTSCLASCTAANDTCATCTTSCQAGCATTVSTCQRDCRLRLGPCLSACPSMAACYANCNAMPLPQRITCLAGCGTCADNCTNTETACEARCTGTGTTCQSLCEARCASSDGGTATTCAAALGSCQRACTPTDC